MALGAQRSDVLKLVLVRSLKLISAGTIIGLIVALMSTRTLRALLYSVSAFDATTFALVTILLGAIALAASYLPAMRATRADPMVVLGHNTCSLAVLRCGQRNWRFAAHSVRLSGDSCDKC